MTNAFNNLNQILSGSWTGSTITAVGAVNYPAGTVTVSGASGTIYADKTFDAAGVPVHLGVNYLTNVFTDLFGRSVTNATSVTITNRAYAHDANGNLTSDGVFAYAYDTANQLTNVVRTADGARVLSARYDALGRRVEATRADGSVERYVYFPGSFLVLAVLDGANAVKEVYTRGPDLSGSLDGAGGIGGLLAVTDSSSVVRYSHADIMGNVIALTDASGSVVSTFRYTPFGQLSARTGSVLSRYLFSSKEFDRTANLYYYGYRYYAPRLGRWMTRDPIEENGELNLYGFVINSPISMIDTLGKEHNNWFRVEGNLSTLQKRTRNAIYVGDCGNFSWIIEWSFSRPVPQGWIIQDISITRTVEDCNGHNIPLPQFDFSEAWEVTRLGNIIRILPTDTDTFGQDEVPGCTKGTVTFRGRAAFHPNFTLPSEFQRTPPSVHPADGLLHTNRRLNLSTGTDSLVHRAVVSWDCCSGRQRSQVSVE